MLKANDSFLEKLYFISCLIFVFTAVWEVPYAVFIGPVFCFGAFVVYRSYTKTPLFFDRTFTVFAVFTVLYCIFVLNPARNLYYQIYVYVQALIMYWLGANAFTEFSPKKKREYLERFFLIVSIMYLTYAAATLFNHFFNTPHDLEDRFYYSFWYGSLVIKPATVIIMSLVFPMTYGVYSLFFLKWQYKIAGVVFIAATLAYSFFSGSRTMLFFFPMLLTGTIITYFIFVKKKVKTAVIFSAVIIVLCAVVLICLKVFKEQIYQRFHEYGFYRIIYEGFTSSLRNQYALNVLKDFSLFYFGGGKHSAELGTPHNIWLYIYDHGGIVPFAAYCVFTVLMAKDGVKMLFSKRVEMQMKFFVYIMFAVILLEYFLEPFMLPLPSFYILGLFLMGVITAEARREPIKTGKKHFVRKKSVKETE